MHPLQLLRRDGHRLGLLDEGTVEADVVADGVQVLPPQGTGVAFSPQVLVLLEDFGHGTTRVDVAEVHLSAGLSRGIK